LIATAVASIALPAQAQIFIRRPEIVIGAPAVVIAPPQVVVEPQPVVVEQAPVVEYVPAPTDAFIVGAAPADIVFIGGDTFIWSVDPYGHRVRHFYGHGDRREEIGRRGEHLRQVQARNGGHLPAHGETHAQAVAHEQQHVASAGGHPGGAPAGGGHPGGAPAGGGHPGGAPAGGGHPGGAPAGGGHPAAPAAHSAPAKGGNEKK